MGLMVSLVAYNDLATISSVLSLSVALMCLLAALISRRGDTSTSLSIWFSIAFSSLALITIDNLRWICVSIGVICAIAHQRWRRHQHEVAALNFPSAPLFIRAIAVILIVWILLYRLDSNFLPPLVWEATTINNLFAELSEATVWNAFKTRLLWAQGLLSEGDRSLLYGYPTLYLLKFKSSFISLRVMSALYFLGTTLFLAAFCKRFFHPTIGLVVLFTFGLNEAGLIFGRYASSIAATLFSVAAAWYACAALIAKPSASKALGAILLLYIATLGYAPGRITVLILLGMTVLGIMWNEAKRRSSRRYGSLVICAGVLIVCAAQLRGGHFHSFAFARGEQLPTMMSNGFWPAPLLEKWNSFKAEDRPPDTLDYISFATELVTTITIPELQQLLSPFDQAPPRARRFSYDPLSLELYAKPLYPFLLLGLLMASRYTTRWIHATLLLCLVVGVVPVLLTSRVDSYRTSMFLIPLSIWLAVGIAEALNEARRARIPPVLVTCVPLAAALAITLHRTDSLHFAAVSPSATDLVIRKVPPRILHNATVGVEAIGFRTQALTNVLLLQREQQGWINPRIIMPEKTYQELVSSEPSEEREKAFEKLVEDLTNHRPLIVGPYHVMTPTLEALSRRGFKVWPLRVRHLELAYVENGARR
jgi:hypothetical protein